MDGHYIYGGDSPQPHQVWDDCYCRLVISKKTKVVSCYHITLIRYWVFVMMRRTITARQDRRK